MIQVEVVYTKPDRQWSVDLELAEGTSAEEAAELAQNSEPLLWVDDLNIVAFAVWGEEVTAEHELKDGDRLELLRPLPVDPMEARRRKAAAAKD
ncbi:MAG: RnfH family protein [Gammaproteobacteria bacterium]|nr:RnfH family protein [Gammaproteobacteria bacterium]